MTSSVEFAAAAFEDLPLHAAIVGGDGRILATNLAWDRFGEGNGAAEVQWTGCNYLEECDRATGDGDENAAVIASALRSVLAGVDVVRVFEYGCDSPDERRVFRMTVSATHVLGQRYAVVLHDNVTPPL